ncbi:MAG: FtsX-like permease family protein, partial [Verrucomicrobiota bacterium]
MPLFLSFVYRYFLRHKVIALFDILSVAIGVSVYLAIQSANTSANQAFRASIDLTAGRSHLEVRGPDGELPETWYPTLRKAPEVAAVTPVLEGFVTLPQLPGRYLHLVGVDAFSNAPFQTVGTTSTTASSFPLESWLGKERQVLLHPSMANELGVGPGEFFSIEIHGRQEMLTVAGIFPEGDLGPEASSSLAVMDIGWAQELFDTPGKVTSLQILLHEPNEVGAIRNQLQASLDPTGSALWQAPQQRSTQVQRMLQGFQLNLTALSMVSILVGVFLIYNTVSASVVRRRREIGILRSTGASRSRVLLFFLGEGLLVGIPGILLGLPLGLFMASFLVDEVSKTISSHYLLLRVTDAHTSLSQLLTATVFGLGAVLVGSYLPAREAARLPPLQALRPPEMASPRSSAIVGARPLILFGAISLLACPLISLLARGSGPPWLSFLSCLLLIVGFSS